MEGLAGLRASVMYPTTVCCVHVAPPLVVRYVPLSVDAMIVLAFDGSGDNPNAAPERFVSNVVQLAPVFEVRNREVEFP